MTFYLSRFVREDVNLEQFTDGLMEFMSHSMKDPQNNISEFDKSLTTMLEQKIYNPFNPRSALIFINPSAAAYILQHPFVIQLLFYPRVFQRKHEWSIVYLSPISRHLCQQNLMSKLPSIYSKYGREIDLNRGIIYLSTIDYFFMSFISYPIIIGPQIPKILNHLYSSYKYEREMDNIKNNKNNILRYIIKQFQMTFQLTTETYNDNKPPINPFKKINFYYSHIFDCYLNIFLGSYNKYYSDYNIKFIEIIAELWFGPSFEERPIGDRIHTLTLMQDLLFKIMEIQIQFQHDFITHNKNNKFSNESCLCPQLKCILKYLYSFFRESFQLFPLDCIANLRIIIEMLLYILAPWHIAYKLRNCDKNIQMIKHKIRQEYEMKEKRKNDKLFVKLIKKYVLNMRENDANDSMNANEFIFLNNNNDDRLRDINHNNTQFETANEMVSYELDGIENVNILIWKQYIIEILPFYSELLNYFINILLKYDLTHPLKQLSVLKVLHLYKNKQIINLICDHENILFNQSNNYINSQTQNNIYILNIITDITFRHISEYKCLPFNNYYKQINNSQQVTATKAQHLYVKCKKTIQMLLSQKDNNHYNKDKMSYFFDTSDNVQIIRYIIGDLESLFNISPELQQKLIMYEQPIVRSTSRSSMDRQIQRMPRTDINNIWDAPTGEYESYYALKLSEKIYNEMISKNEKVNEFYCKYLLKFNRKYLTDIRFIGWNVTLILTYLLCHYVLFYMVLFMFSLALMLPVIPKMERKKIIMVVGVCFLLFFLMSNIYMNMAITIIICLWMTLIIQEN